MKTVLVDLWSGQRRGEGGNGQTRIARARAVAAPARTLFEHAYATFAAPCRAVDEPGLAIVAVDETTGSAAGMVCARARIDRHTAAIVGRHDRCDLYLDAHAQLALRHLAIVVSPVRDWRQVSYRVLDLRTTDGMIDEHGRTLRGLRCEGAAIVRCGGYTLFLLPLGDPTDWPERAADAWACLPERVYFDELERTPDASCVRPLAPARRDQTLVVRTMGPHDTSTAFSGDVAGRLLIRGPHAQGAITISTRALRDGILLGRYARCDDARLATDPSLSRVHALLLHVDDRLLAIDIASTNGTRFPGRGDARVLELVGDGELELGTDTLVRWCGAS
ncbi:MAG: FHA domain-containing protein [Kofleriaceae bacterium]|nr:FHA domain-containing protein [Kofleriaceae bacterium]